MLTVKLKERQEKPTSSYSNLKLNSDTTEKMNIKIDDRNKHRRKRVATSDNVIKTVSSSTNIVSGSPEMFTSRGNLSRDDMTVTRMLTAAETLSTETSVSLNESFSPSSMTPWMSPSEGTLSTVMITQTDRKKTISTEELSTKTSTHRIKEAQTARTTQVTKKKKKTPAKKKWTTVNIIPTKARLKQRSTDTV